jgi:hypothetical protein
MIYYEEPRGKYYIGYVTGPGAIDHRRGDYTTQAGRAYMGES